LIITIVGIVVGVAFTITVGYYSTRAVIRFIKERTPGSPNGTSESIQFLCWEGLDDRELLGKFEDAQVVPRKYIRDDIFSLLESLPPNEVHWDVVLADIEVMEHLCRMSDQAKSLQPLPMRLDRYFDKFLQPMRDDAIKQDTLLYAVPVRFGVNAIAYNTRLVISEVLHSYEVLFTDTSLKGRIGIWNWWLPIMGMVSKYLSTVSGSSLHGNPHPYRINDSQLDEVVQTIQSLTQQDPICYDNIIAAKRDLENGEVLLMLGGGESFVPFKEEGPTLKSENVDWAIPKEGGLLWIECVGIFNGTDNQYMAQRFIEFLLRDDIQKMIPTKGTYRSDVVLKEVMEKLSEVDKRIHKVFHEDNIGKRRNGNILIRRELPSEPESWQQKWTEATQQWRKRE